MMHEHAKKIYQAALDGKTVQAKTEEGWKDDDPFRGPFHPIDFPLSWRIKPKTNTRYYRVYLIAETNEVRVIEVLNKEEKLDAELFIANKVKHFRWISEWVPYKVEVKV